MLLRISRFDDLDERKLMDIYSESNFENTDYFFPDLEDKKEAVRKVEEGFLGFLKDEFFSQSGSEYWVLESDGVWVSALRQSRIEDGLYYLEALETRPDCRRQGHAVHLLDGVIDELKKAGPFRICDCISKRNTASIKTHQKCGFSIVSEAGYDYLLNESDDHDYGLEYRFSL